MTEDEKWEALEPWEASHECHFVDTQCFGRCCMNPARPKMTIRWLAAHPTDLDALLDQPRLYLESTKLVQ